MELEDTGKYSSPLFADPSRLPYPLNRAVCMSGTVLCVEREKGTEWGLGVRQEWRKKGDVCVCMCVCAQA